ncbi:hypothetical protein C6P45_000077 [Maudiozyma exigua]|uniref:Inner membrane assembly complex subunit 22 n=1 Tax=Maudiozyma exigua TaxID=34358 RepID=A0A9P7BDW8_MAUEX|nr:hypothetical protein C6P45_000077 [Kazachstania exigua]
MYRMMKPRFSGLRVPKAIRNVIRFQHSGTSTGITEDYAARATFDRSMIRPFIWVVVFGSLVTHVIDRRQAYNDMEKRYALKITILNDLLAKVESGDRNISEENIDKELELVNKMFVKDKSLGMKEVEHVLSQMQITVPKQEAYDFDEEESLEDIWKSIVEDSTTDKPLEKCKKIVEPVIKATDTSADGIVLDKETLQRLRAEEKYEAKDFNQSTDQHLIVENPGDLSSSAKFL